MATGFKEEVVGMRKDEKRRREGHFLIIKLFRWAKLSFMIVS